ncbi:MAG: hypothetical protein GMKNLPBB_01596 [Myxococcota bacterium]|nr:hypothetical protein [Myxococcota bacterium]
MNDAPKIVVAIGGSTYFVDVNQVERVIILEKVSPAPLAPAAVAGIAVDRGNVVTLFDLDAWVKKSAPASPPRMAMVLRRGDRNLAIVINEVLGTAGFESLREGVQSPAAELLGESLVNLGEVRERPMTDWGGALELDVNRVMDDIVIKIASIVDARVRWRNPGAN